MPARVRSSFTRARRTWAPSVHGSLELLLQVRVGVGDSTTVGISVFKVLSPLWKAQESESASVESDSGGFIRSLSIDLMTANPETVRAIVVDDLQAAINDVLMANDMRPPLKSSAPYL